MRKILYKICPKIREKKLMDNAIRHYFRIDPKNSYRRTIDVMYKAYEYAVLFNHRLINLEKRINRLDNKQEVLEETLEQVEKGLDMCVLEQSFHHRFNQLLDQMDELSEQMAYIENDITGKSEQLNHILNDILGGVNNDA